jgi:hypothetical protein
LGGGFIRPKRQNSPEKWNDSLDCFFSSEFSSEFRTHGTGLTRHVSGTSKARLRWPKDETKKTTLCSATMNFSNDAVAIVVVADEVRWNTEPRTSSRLNYCICHRLESTPTIASVRHWSTIVKSVCPSPRCLQPRQSLLMREWILYLIIIKVADLYFPKY